MSLFRLDASILPAASTSAEIADIVEKKWTAAHPGEAVVRRHLGTDPLPADAWAHATVATFTPESEHTPDQRKALALARELAGELQAADAVVLAVPLYNYGISQHFKTWADLVIAGAGPTNPLLKGTPTVLVTVRGGGYGPGTPREGWDHGEPWLRHALSTVGLDDLAFVTAELTLARESPRMIPLDLGAAEDRSMEDALEAISALAA